MPVSIEKELSDAYLDYSMSVIIGRALPDVRDGLKPVHRRILYAMWKEGLLSSRRFSKCAGVVGEVLKKYHPHGDMAVYDALVRMAQPWNMRNPLVDGQGNFGSVDGDSAAAYRYTECKMTRVAEELLGDIDQETVNFSPNYDGSVEEPDVLPAAFPNLLVNGAEGIAVGMATKIPPHNLGEVINGLLALTENPDITIAELMKHIPGPDFPTAGLIRGREGIIDAYTTGRGRVMMRGVASFEEIEGREAIVITELPFQVNKARFQEAIADLVKEKRLEGIHAIRDESDRQGMRVVIELKRDAIRDVVLNNLYKHTDLQTTFGTLLLAIVNNRPQVLTLKECLQYYLAHRREVTLRRTRYQLRRALERAHILEGLRKALDAIDLVISIIRASKTGDEARANLIDALALSELQAQAILDMRLQRLTGLERDKLEAEYNEVQARIALFREILGDEGRLLQVIREELTAVRDRYAEPRRTQIVNESGELSMHDLVAEEDQVVTLSHLGYIKRTTLSEYRMQKRGGMGKTAMRARDEDFVEGLFLTSTHSRLLVFTTGGQMYDLRVLDIPEGGPAARGKPVVNLIQLESGEKVASVISIKEFSEDQDLIFVSKKGMVKRTELKAYENVRTRGLIACDVAEGDGLFTVIRTTRTDDIMLTSKGGLSIRFPGSDVRPLSRTARGVRGIELDGDDEVVGAAAIPPESKRLLLTVTSAGLGKRTELPEYRVQSRGGKGIIAIDIDTSTTRVAGTVVLENDSDQVMVVTDTGRCIRTRVDEIRIVGRNSKGVRVMRLEEGERIVSLAHLPEVSEGSASDAAPAEVSAVVEAEGGKTGDEV